MSRTERQVFPNRADGLRLFALGRVSRCGGCARFRVFNAVFRSPGSFAGPLPAVPRGCNHQLCAPLAARYENRIVSRSTRPNRRLRVVGNSS